MKLASLSIGQAAARSGVSAKMIRYYESIGLIRRAARSEGNYRTYDRDAVRILRFVARARDLGFSVQSISQLLRLWLEPERSSAEVKAIALQHIDSLDQKIAALREVRGALKHLTDHCHGDDRPACPIIEDLAGDKSKQPKRRQRHV
ncbi:MAG TPA: Cu(I)-responsive transcriptional regulator [Rhodopila sp.]|nr:Cu(I)-responsive transcriptional regulator [Rhodopila sp.]